MSIPNPSFIFLQVGNQLATNKGSTKLIFADSGKFAGTLRLYHDDDCIWSPDLGGKSGARFWLGDDGFLHIDDARGLVIWTGEASVYGSKNEAFPLAYTELVLYDDPASLSGQEYGILLPRGPESYAIVFAAPEPPPPFSSGEKVSSITFYPQNMDCWIVIASVDGHSHWVSDSPIKSSDNFDLIKQAKHFTWGRKVVPGLRWKDKDNKQHEVMRRRPIYIIEGGAHIEFRRDSSDNKSTEDLPENQ